MTRFWLHLCWIGLGAVGCVVVGRMDYKILQRFHLPKFLWGLACILLVVVLVPGIGISRNGAFRWLFFGQPSEFAKLALIIFLADYGARYQSRMGERSVGFILPGVMVAMVTVLIFLEPDWGTAILLGVLSLALLAVAGAHWGYLVSAGIVGAELVVLLLLGNPLRMERLLAFLDPERYREGVGWQGWHSILALGSGGWFGTFFGDGIHKNGFVPEQQTDFVLSLLGEETGFMGTSLVMLLFMAIMFCGFRIVWRISDVFGQLLATGITLLIGLQTFINIGVVTSTLPNKGIALPFVSYGGSNIVCMLVGVGLLVSVARRGPVPEDGSCRNLIQPSGEPDVGGPVGSLLSNSIKSAANGPLRGSFARWLQSRRNARFPSVPTHAYQRPPRQSQTTR